MKTGRFDDGVIRVKGKSQHTNSSGHVYETYDGDVDYFLAYCYGTETMYWIPETDMGATKDLRIATPERSDPSINWAENYEFDTRWPPDPTGDQSG